MSSQDSTTLRHLLTQKKPPVSCFTKANKNTANTKWPELLDSVVIWTEFNLDNLNESYSHVLDVAIPSGIIDSPRPDGLAGISIHKEHDVNHLISWNDKLMQETLQWAKSHLGLHPGIRLQSTYTSADRSTLARILHASGGGLVHHVISLDDYPGPNLVVGFSRTSVKWSGGTVANQLNNLTAELRWPLRQLARICEMADTRYGYIQTDQELVVCCFSPIQKDNWKVAIMPIPWSKHGQQDGLTTDLALWWLSMLAMPSRSHRALVAEAEIVKIDDWEQVCDQGNWVLRHRYSGLVQPMSPQSLQSQRTPSSNNSAAIAPAFNSHTDNQFDVEGQTGGHNYEDQYQDSLDIENYDGQGIGQDHNVANAATASDGFSLGLRGDGYDFGSP